jgi:TP901 family phage tail tape measure protein
MADEQIVTNIVATSDFSGLIADVQRTTSALSKLQQELSLSNKTLAAQAGQIQKAFGETLRSTGQFTTHFVTVGSEVEAFGKKLDAGKLKLGDYFRTWQQHTKTSGGLIRDLAKQQVALQNAIVQPLGKSADGLMKFNVHVANGLNETANKTALARKELQIYNKVIQDGGVQLINWGKNTQWAGRQLTVGLTVPLAAFGAAAAKAFREADQELVRLTKVYGGLTATSAQELAKVRKDVSATARELSAAYGSSFKDTISLAADLAATGKQGNELLLATKEATRLSVLGEVDRQEAMKATLAIQSAFKQNTEELSTSINFLNAVENQTSTSLADLVEAIPKAGPVVKALGGDVQDLALYLTAMREGGVNASEGANALKSALASIINPTKVAKEMFEGFGIDLGGIVTKNAGNLTATILGIQSALDTLNPLQKSQAIEQLFGKFQFARMNALFENLGKQGSQTLQVLDLMKASSQDLANVAGRELSQITESASGQYKRAIESLKADLAGLGDQFLKIGTFFIKVVDGVVKFITKLPDPIKNFLGLLGGITALAGPLIMLTGVFANFIGYVVKGIGHIRALGKGGEGFKLLTPQILAAEKAGSLIEKTFYSDAAAAGVLKDALSNLTNELTILQQKAASGSISVQPTLSTIQGNVVLEGLNRVADPNNPLIGKPYTRQMSHLNPVAGMTTAERAAQTIFGVVPGPGPVNQRIGKNPQIYAEGDLPNIEGVTSIKGVSTGIVAQEAAKWHSMTAALAMQSEDEIKLLKREIASTGAITTELSTSYQALLPQMTNITSTAAQEAKLIVGQLQAGKITVDQARTKIISLNAQVEAMMAETAAAVATSQGRTANIMSVPLTGQPVVDPATGKTNMKEMFHKSKTSALVDKIARALGVRTSGGGYSTHTTIPRKFKDGGDVFYNNGDQVPGPNVNADVVPAMLTPGEFVIKRDVAQQDPDGMRALNAGQAMIVPVQGRNLGGLIARMTPRGRKILSTPEIQKVWRNIFGKGGSTPKPEYEPKGTSGIFGGQADSRKFSASTAKINKDMETIGVDPKILLASINARGGGARTSTDVFLYGLAQSGIISKRDYRRLSKQAFDTYAKKILDMDKVTDNNNPVWSVSNQILSKEFSKNPDALAFWNEYSRQPGSFADVKYRSSSNFLNKLTINGKTANFANLESSGSNKFYHAKEESNPFISKLNSYFAANSGGMVPGYVGGGRIPKLPASVIARLTANWPKNKQFYQPGFQYKLGNQDPLHGPLQIGKSQNLKRYAGYNPADFRSESVVYTDDRFNRLNIMPAFLTGDEKRRGMYATSRYMAGDLDIMSQMERLGNHPLGPISAMKAVQQKFSGKLYRGIIAGKTRDALPKHIEDAIIAAKQTGDWSSLLGKEFIMRRSSWSKDKTIANYFAKRGADPKSIILEAAVRNRNIVPAGDLFPDRVFRAPYGQDYPVGKFGGGIERSEQEAVFGGKFRIVGYKNGRLQVETVAEARAMGGPVNSGKPYLVGEKGPELFVPRNNGGIIPNYRLGGGVDRYGRLRDNIRGNRPLGRSSMEADPNSGMASSMAGMAMMMGGSQIPGMAGQAMTFAGIGMQMLPMLKMMKPMLSGMSSFAGILAKVRVAGVATFTALRAGLAALMGPVGLASMAIGGLVAGFLKLKKDATNAGEVNRATFGLTSTALEEVGIKYKTVSERLKEVNQQLELNRAKVKASYEAYTKSGVAGLDLTLKELKDGIANAKKEDKESVGLFDKAKASQVNQLAASMKAQYVSLGMSVQEATNQVYILIKASNKSAQAINAISSESFKQISDRASAARYTVEMLGKVLSTKGLFNAEEFSRGLDNMLNSLDAYKNSLMETTKTQTGLSETESLKKTFDEIKKTGMDRVKIEGKSLDALKQQDIVLGTMLGKAETLASVFAKYQLYSSGMSADIDIAALNPDQAVLAAQGSKTSMDAAEVVLSKTKLAISTKSAEDASEKANQILKNAAKQDNSYIDAAIKNKQKLINKLEEERAARLKILDLQEKSANFETEIQQAQLRYQEALAAGDMAQAAQEQLNIQKLSADKQRDMARQSINDKADAERKKLEADIEKLQAEKDAKAKALVSAQNNASTKADQAASARSFLEEIKAAITTFGGDKKNDIQQFAELLNRMRQKGRGSDVNDLFTSFGVDQKGENAYGKLLNELKSGKKGLDKELESSKYDKFDLAVQTFSNAVNKFAGTGEGSYANPINAGTGQGTIGVNNINWGNQTMGFGLSDREKVKAFAEKKGYEPGTQFTLKNASGEVLQFLVLPDGNIQLQKRIKPEKRAMGGYIKHYNPGGRVYGPGTGTSDSIPAMLSNGEYVINAKSVQAAGIPMLDSINKMAAGGLATRYNIPSGTVSVANSPFNRYNQGGLVNNYGGITVNPAPGMNEEMLARYVMAEIKRADAISFASQGRPGSRLI